MVDEYGPPEPVAPADEYGPPEPITAAPAGEHPLIPPDAEMPEMAQAQGPDEAAFGAWKSAQLGVKPQDAGWAWAAARRRGLNPTWVAQNLEAVKAQDERDDRAAILRDHPALAREFADPVKGAVLKDDLEGASMWERLFAGRDKVLADGTTQHVEGGIIRAIKRGADPTPYALGLKQMAGQASDEELARLDALEKGQTDFGAEGPIEKAVYGVAEMLPFLGVVGGAGIATAALGAPAAVAAGVGGAVMGGLTFLQNAGPLYRKILAAGTEQVPAEYDAQGNETMPAHSIQRVDPDVAFALAGGASVLAAGGAAALGPEALGGLPVVGKFFQSVAGEGIAKVVANKTLSRAVEDGFRAWGGHWVSGVGMMVAQTTLNGATALAGRAHAGLEVGSQELRDLGSEVLASAEHAALSMAIISTWQPGREFARDLGRMARAREDAGRFEVLTRSVTDASIRPQDVERVIAELRQDGLAGDDISTVYVEQRALEALAKKEGQDPAALAAALVGDKGEAWTAAKLNGGALPIPVEMYAARVIKNGLHEALREDIRFSPDGWTPREAATHEKVFQKLQEQATPEVAGQLEGIRQQWMDAALAAGRGKAEARIAGDHLAAIVGTAAIREGVSPAEWVAAHPLPEVYGPGMTPQGGLEQPGRATLTPEFKTWFGESKVTRLVASTGEKVPQRVYHSTDAKFSEFTAGELGFHFGDKAAAKVIGGRHTVEAYLSIRNPLRMPDVGVWGNPGEVLKALAKKWNLFSEQEIASIREKTSALEETLKARLDDSNPDFLDRKKAQREATQPIREALQAKGYDGIVYKNDAEGFGDGWIAFDPTQIKSVRNRGTYDPADVNILHQPGRPLDLDGARATVLEQPPNPDLALRPATLLATAQQYKGKFIDLVFVPDLVAALKAQGLSRQAIFDALIREHRAGRLELQIESGLGRLTKEQLEDAPIGAQNNRLTWGRITDEGQAVLLDRTEARGKLLIITGATGKRYEIHLGAQADVSTLAHETMHWLTDTLMDRALSLDAPADIRADMDALAKWMGYAGGAEERAKGLNVKAEERASHAWEQYLAEGRAPTDALQKTFGRFAKWMAKLYGPTNGLGEGGVGDVYAKEHGQALDLTPEVRAIFDRLLATADEMESKPAPLDRDSLIATAPEAERAGLQARARAQQVRADSARRLLEDKPVSSLSPAFYLRQERAAAREALDLAKKGKVAEAIDADARRAWAEAMGREAKKFRLEEGVHSRYFERQMRDDARAELGKLTVEVNGETTQPYLDAFDALVAGLDPKASTSRAAVDRRKATQAYIERAKANGQDVVMPDSVLRNLDKVTRTRDLSIKDLRDLRQAVQNLVHLADLKSTLLEKGKRVSRDKVVGEAVAQVQESMGQKPLLEQNVLRTLKEKVSDAFGKFVQANVRPEFLISAIDGGKENGVFRRILWNVLNDATNEHTLLAGNLADTLHQHIAEMPAEDLARWASTTFTVNGTTKDLRAALAVALNWGTASNRGKLVRGWMSPNVSQKGIRPWNEKTPQEYLQHLTAKDWEFVQKVWRSLDSMWPREVDLEKRLTGLAPEKVPGLKFQVKTADGKVLDIEGGYYPMIYDRQFREVKAPGVENGGPFNPDYNRAAPPNGHLVGRIEGYARPVELSIEPLVGKIVEHAKDVTMREALISAYDFLTDERVRSAIQMSSIGDNGHRILLEWVRERANDFTVPDNGSKVAERFFQAAQNATVGSIFSFNVGQTLQNLTGMVTATKNVGPGWMAESLRQFAHDREGMVAFVRSQSKEMAARNITADIDLRNELKKFGVPKSRIELLNEAGRAFWESTDKVVAYSTWLADFNRSVAPASEGGRGMTDIAAARAHADMTVRMKVMAGGGKDLPPILRNQFVRGFLPFFGFLNHRFNMMYEAKTQGDRMVREEGKSRLGAYTKTMGTAIALYMAEAILSKLVTGQGPEKKKKEKGLPVNGNDWGRFMVKTALSSPTSMVPVLGAVGRQIESGRDVNFSAQAQLYTLWGQTGAKVFTAIEDPTVQHALDAAMLAGEGTGRALGLPVPQFKNTAGYIKSVATGQHKPKGVGDVALGVTFGRKSKLKAAIYGPQREPPKRR